MFARLRHHAFVSRDHQRDQIDAVRSRQHVLHKPFMTRHIDKADAHLAEIEIGKAYVDCNAAPLLFRQPISIDSGKRAHQCSLPVIDVPGSANNDGFHLELLGRKV